MCWTHRATSTPNCNRIDCGLYSLQFQGKKTLNVDGWEAGATAGKIKEAVGSFQAGVLPGGYYRFTTPSVDMQLILDSFGVNATLRIPTAADLRRLRSTFDKAGIRDGRMSDALMRL